MKKDTRLSDVLHVLLHMAEHDGPVTSDALAQSMRSNPAVVRRTMAGLRRQGLVHSSKGHGGGWTIARDLASVTLRDVYEALGSPPVFALGHRAENPHCLVEAAVNDAMKDTFDAARAILLGRLEEVTLAGLSATFHQRYAMCQKENRHAT
ncbi:Rrf2 family transcriptional regulator [Luteibacter rhizovicinus]|nr:Rrf2 family transcriptional regulator [Luteibacter rhizovicinus]